jgi:hypothetical protein
VRSGFGVLGSGFRFWVPVLGSGFCAERRTLNPEP